MLAALSALAGALVMRGIKEPKRTRFLRPWRERNLVSRHHPGTFLDSSFGRNHGLRLRYFPIGGASGGSLWTCFGGSGHSNWQVADFAGRLDGGEGIQRAAQDSRLSSHVARLAECAAKRVLDGCNAWDADGRRQVGNGSQADGAEAGGFEFSLSQSNGPAADRSGRDEDDGIDPVLAQVLDHRGHALGEQPLGAQEIAHHRVVPGSDGADFAGPGQLAQTLNREKAVQGRARRTRGRCAGGRA